MAQASFRRWQSLAIQQKQTTSALMLGLSGAALAFAVSQLTAAASYIGFWPSVLFHLAAVSNLVSIASGVAFSFNRMRDFDLTSWIARTRELTPESARLGSMRHRVRQWGRITRRVFLIQALFFGGGILALLGFVIWNYRHILYATPVT